jgi:hypothetical protein
MGASESKVASAAACANADCSTNIAPSAMPPR